MATHNAAFASACVRAGHRVTVLAAGSMASSRTHDNGVTVHRLPLPVLHKLRRVPLLGRYERALGMLIYSKQAAERLRTLVDESCLVEAADINAEAFFAQVPALFVRCHTPTALLEQTKAAAVSFRSDARPLIWAERRAVQKAAALSAPSVDMAVRAAALMRYPRERIAALPNALDTDFFTPTPSAAAGAGSTVLWVGRLDPGKGLDVLAAAMETVLPAAPDVRFVLVGGGRKLADGSSTDALLRARFATDLAAGRVVLRGFVPDADLPSVYGAAAIAVVPSLIYESFSYTCAQAMACGIPVIASAVGGIPETLAQGECGVLVPPADSAALAAAILTLAHDPARRAELGAAGRARAVAHFQADAASAAILEWYRRWM